MLGRTYDGEVCSAARALEIVGERWSLLIVRKALFGGARRFGDFRSLGIATTVFPIAMAGAIFHASINNGKFHGMICPTTPTG